MALKKQEIINVCLLLGLACLCACDGEGRERVERQQVEQVDKPAPAAPAAAVVGADLSRIVPPGGGLPEDLPEGDVDALLASLAAAVEAGDKTFKVPQGVYQFGRRAFELKKVKDMEIDGQGSTFIFSLHEYSRVHLEECRGVTLKRLFLDVEHPPFIQGTIQAIDPANRTIDMSVDEGFLESNPVNPKTEFRCAIMDSKGERLLPMPDSFVKPPVKLESGLLRVNPWGMFNAEKLIFSEGDKIVLSMFYYAGGGGLKLTRSSECLVEDVWIFKSGGFSFHESGVADGGNVYRRCRLAPRPGSPSIWSGGADAFHSANQRRGHHLIDCELSRAFDDLINIHGFINLVVEIRAPDELLLAGPFERDFEVGDTIKFYRHPDAVPTGEAVVVEITPVEEPSRKEVERRATEYFTPTNKDYPVRSFPRSEPCLVKFDRPVVVKEFDLAMSSGYAGAGAVIENCHLHNGVVRGVLVKSDATIKNCTIEHMHRSGILASAQQFWLEGPMPENVKIIGNLIRNCGFSSIQNEFSISVNSGFSSPRENLSHVYNIRDIEISNNTFENIPGVAISLINVDGALIENNTFINPFSGIVNGEKLAFTKGVPESELKDVMENPYYSIVAISCKNFRVSGNRVEGATPLWRGMIGAGAWSENIKTD